MRWSLRSRSVFQRCRSLPRVLACALCRITSSTCCLERSSALIVALLRMSRSCSRSVICLLSTSACFWNCSSSLVRPAISFRRAFRAASSFIVSASPASLRRRSASNCRWIRALPCVRPASSSCRPLSCSCRSEPSRAKRSRAESSSLYKRFSCSRFASRRSFAALRRSTSSRSSRSWRSSCAMPSELRLRSSLRALTSLCRASMACRSSLRSRSSFSLRRCCFSLSDVSARSCSCRAKSSLLPAWRSCSSFCTLEPSSEFVDCSWPTWPLSMSRCLMRSFFSCTSWFTMFSWLMLSPAPCSTRRPSLEISPLRLWMVSLARCSFSCEVSTIFQARSISFFSAVIVAWSSWESFSAVCTFTAFCTISVLSSRHFLMRCFSLSWDFFSARWSFSYSWRKCSRLLSPTSSCRISWKSRSSASKAEASKFSSPSLAFSSMARWASPSPSLRAPGGGRGGRGAA
mmetsp:Transcript_78077/g.236745  ORF Transcript_78077/g.236745 Transcript_78077/m.236745 type:complete len:460 (-) Transcript_78077:11-1390(-)